MKSNKPHILRTNLIVFSCFCLLSVISPPRYDAVSQNQKPVVLPKNNEMSQKAAQKYDSSNIIIEKKLDSLELNTKRLEQGTEKVDRTTSIMKRQGKELDKHTILINQIENKLKSDSLIESDKSKINPAKKKNEICIDSDSLRLPEIKSVEPKRKGFLKRWFGF